MEREEQAIASNNGLFLKVMICLSLIAFSFTYYQDNPKDKIYKKVWQEFVFNWRMVFDHSPRLTHQFFSIRFSIDGKGDISQVEASSRTDSILFSRSVKQLKNRLSKSLFKPMGIRNTSVIFPVFIFVQPQTMDTLYFVDTDVKPDPNFRPDTLIYDKELYCDMGDIWVFKQNSKVLNKAIVFPPIVYFLKRGIPDFNTNVDYRKLKGKHPLEYEGNKPIKLKIPPVK